jgi:hypothetical protein
LKGLREQFSLPELCTCLFQMWKVQLLFPLVTVSTLVFAMLWGCKFLKTKLLVRL